jgi:hypothetical protein
MVCVNLVNIFLHTQKETVSIKHQKVSNMKESIIKMKY